MNLNALCSINPIHLHKLNLKINLNSVINKTNIQNIIKSKPQIVDLAVISFVIN